MVQHSTLRLWTIYFEPRHDRTEYDLPPQPKPTPSAWRLWRNTLMTAFLPDQPHNLQLRQRLGTWHKVPPHWHWFLDPTTNTFLNAATHRHVKSIASKTAANIPTSTHRSFAQPPPTPAVLLQLPVMAQAASPQARLHTFPFVIPLR